MGVTIVGCDRHEWSEAIPPHRRTHGGLILVTSGSGYLGVAAGPDAIVEHSVEAGDHVVFLPYEDHSYRPEPGTALCTTMVRFELAEDGLFGRALRELGSTRRFERIPNAPLTVDAIVNLLSRDNEYATRSAESLLESILYASIASVVPRRTSARETPIDRAMETLYGDSSSRLTEVAEDLGLSVETIRKEFRRHFDDTPMHYFTQYRVSAIAHRLETSDASLHELAEEFGFYDEFHLSRVFKRHVGVPPGEYRKRFQ